jgi:plastocyanin
MFDNDIFRSTKSQLIISSLMVLFAIGLYATPDAFAEHSMNATVENAAGSSTPGCEPDCFLPSTVTIGVGGMVTFANNDSAAHTSTSGSGADGPSGVWDSSLVMMNSAYTTPALDAGEYPYFCMVHPWMEGLVIVTDDHSAATSQPEPEPEVEDTTSTSTAANTVENAQGSSTPGCEPDCFIPATITINPGESVTFSNSDSAAHTSTAGTPADGPSGVWDSSLVMMNSAYTTPALDAGEYPYFCMVHPWMEGTVIVGEGSTTPSQAESSQAEDDAAARIATAEAAAAAAEAEAAARIAEAEAAARIAAAEAAATAAETASQQAIAELSVNEKIEITMDFTNDSDVQQSFALIVQIKDSNNTTISLSHVTGMLGAGQTLDQVLSYTPNEAGTYTVEKFLWNNFADPTALTDSKETFSLTVS